MRSIVKSCLIVVLVVLAFAGCRGADMVGVDNQRAPEHAVQLSQAAVPFHMSVMNTIEIVPPPPPPVINAVFPGSGKSKPFGPFEMHATSQIDVTVFPFAQTTQYVFTFRNGDELYATSVGIGIEDPPGTAAFNGEFTITGGTGHFANASGTATYAGTADTFAGTGQFEIDGVISGFGGTGN